MSSLRLDPISSRSPLNPVQTGRQTDLAAGESASVDTVENSSAKATPQRPSSPLQLPRRQYDFLRNYSHAQLAQRVCDEHFLLRKGAPPEVAAVLKQYLSELQDYMKYVFTPNELIELVLLRTTPLGRLIFCQYPAAVISETDYDASKFPQASDADLERDVRLLVKERMWRPEADFIRVCRQANDDDSSVSDCDDADVPAHVDLIVKRLFVGLGKDRLTQVVDFFKSKLGQTYAAGLEKLQDRFCDEKHAQLAAEIAKL